MKNIPEIITVNVDGQDHLVMTMHLTPLLCYYAYKQGVLTASQCHELGFEHVAPKYLTNRRAS